MSRITLGSSFRHWLDLWQSLQSDLNAMFTELYSTPPSTLQTEEIVATVDGLTTGIITQTNNHVFVTSENAAHFVTLPPAGLLLAGSKVTGVVGENGFELVVPSAQADTVYINGVTEGVAAAIPADSSFEALCIDATHWLLKCWDASGDVVVIIPDAI